MSREDPSDVGVLVCFGLFCFGFFGLFFWFWFVLFCFGLFWFVLFSFFWFWFVLFWFVLAKVVYEVVITTRGNGNPLCQGCEGEPLLSRSAGVFAPSFTGRCRLAARGDHSWAKTGFFIAPTQASSFRTS